MKLSDITVNDILKLTAKASHDSDALTALQKINQMVANNANRRMKTFNKADQKSPAMKQLQKAAKRITGSKTGNLSKSKKLTVKELKQQILSGMKFLNAKTGTLKGYNEWVIENIEAIEDRYKIKLDRDKIEEFKDFLDTEMFKELKDFDSDRILKDAVNMVNAGVTAEELNASWERYQNHQSVSLLDEWEDLKNASESPFT